MKKPEETFTPSIVVVRGLRELWRQIEPLLTGRRPSRGGSAARPRCDRGMKRWDRDHLASLCEARRAT